MTKSVFTVAVPLTLLVTTGNGLLLDRLTTNVAWLGMVVLPNMMQLRNLRLSRVRALWPINWTQSLAVSAFTLFNIVKNGCSTNAVADLEKLAASVETCAAASCG